MYKNHKWCGFLFGAFLIVFTFVSWAAAKWIIFAGGILMVFHALFGEKYCCNKTTCCEMPVEKPKVKSKAKKKK